MTERAVRTARQRHAFFLDIDGTLVDFQASPQAVQFDADVRRILQALRRTHGGAVALISGRPLSDIDRLMPSRRRFPAAGQHGTERRTASGRLYRHAAASVPLDHVRAALEAAISAYPALRIENKGQSIALHYRLKPSLARVAARVMKHMQRISGPAFSLQHGKCVVELIPSGRHKGLAIREFLHEPPFAGRLPIFIGDDVTDERGFEVVNRLGGVSIKVGAGHTRAHWRFPDTGAVLAWLAERAGVLPASRRSDGRRRAERDVQIKPT